MSLPVDHSEILGQPFRERASVHNAYLLSREGDDAASRPARRYYLLHQVDLTPDTHSVTFQKFEGILTSREAF